MKNPQLLSLAANPNTPAPVLEELAANSEDKEVLVAIAQNPNSSSDLLVELANKYFDCLLAVENSPYLDLVLLVDFNFVEKLYGDTLNSEFKEKISLPDRFLTHAISIAIGPEAQNSKNRSFKYLVAKHKNTPSHVLEKLATSDDFNLGINKEVASNLNTDQKTLEKLSKSSNPSIKERVAKNISTSASILEKLSLDSNDCVKIAVAKNSNANVNTKERLAKDPTWVVRLELAKNNNNPLFVLEILSEDSDWRIRERIASSRKTPISLLEKLTKDPSDHVKSAAIENPQIPISLLEELKLAASPRLQAELRAKQAWQKEVKLRIEREKLLSQWLLKGTIKNVIFAVFVSILFALIMSQIDREPGISYNSFKEWFFLSLTWVCLPLISAFPFMFLKLKLTGEL